MIDTDVEIRSGYRTLSEKQARRVFGRNSTRLKYFCGKWGMMVYVQLT